jgi:flavin reductase (DIM6/NTAB) family NADH-FMN oxidoreductase RutF/DNA-binding IclR family transcriptional regulator
MNDFDSNEFRRVMGAFPTGVVVVTATNETGEALAMTVGSFVSVSLDPPLVGFLPTKTSSSWAALRASGTRFGVNVLGNTQEDVCRAVARRKTDKLDGFDWTPSALGNPRLSDAIAFIDCDTESIFDGGDHDIVIGRVHSLETVKNNLPLLFFRGGYGSFRPGSMAVGAGIPSARLHELDVVRPHLERLADNLTAEVTAMCRVDEDLVTVAAAGITRKTGRSSRVGRHVPFMPPIGGVFAAFGGPGEEQTWLESVHEDADEASEKAYRSALERVRESGYAFGIGHQAGSAIESYSEHANAVPTPEERRTLTKVIGDSSRAFNAGEITRDGEYEFHSATAPVFDKDGTCVFSLTVWGPSGLTPGVDVLAVFDKLTRAAEACSADLKRAKGVR